MKKGRRRGSGIKEEEWKKTEGTTATTRKKDLRILDPGFQIILCPSWTHVFCFCLILFLLIRKGMDRWIESVVDRRTDRRIDGMGWDRGREGVWLTTSTPPPLLPLLPPPLVTWVAADGVERYTQRRIKRAEGEGVDGQWT